MGSETRVVKQRPGRHTLVSRRAFHGLAAQCAAAHAPLLAPRSAERGGGSGELQSERGHLRSCWLFSTQRRAVVSRCKRQEMREQSFELMTC